MRTCSADDQFRYAVYHRTEVYSIEGRWVPDGPWVFQGDACRARADVVTESDVIEAVSEFGLPSADARIQPPNGRTLVGFETNFYTTQSVETFDLVVLDTAVRIRATPTLFNWQFGDGVELTTAEPGRPFPHLDVVHEYERSGEVEVSVDIAYLVEWDPGDGNGYREIETPIHGGPGTSTNLVVLEKSDRLVEMGQHR